jgi:putative PIN family toxin of toxin-antitoxin system
MQNTHWQRPVEKRRQEELIVVIDTNVFISYLWGSKNAETIAELLFEGKIRPLLSEAVFHELCTVGHRGKFKQKFSPEVFLSLCEAYRNISVFVVPKKKITVSVDTKDNIFLECAFEGKADYIITGDQHLLKIGNYEGVFIVTPADFLKMIQSPEIDSLIHTKNVTLRKTPPQPWRKAHGTPAGDTPEFDK